MSSPEVLQTIVAQFSPVQDVTIGKWLGKPCVQANKKVFVALWGRDLVFKLGAVSRAQALEIPGAHMWKPIPAGNPRPEWVQLPADQSSEWKQYASLAFDYVSSLPRSND